MTFQIRKIFHLIHMSGDFSELNAWYRDVFNPRYYADHMTAVFPTWELEKRDATLIALADTVIEPMSPSTHLEGWEQLPVGRFYNKFGRHWHSIAWYVDDTIGLYRSLKDNKVRFFFNGGGSDSDREPQPTDALFTHPKDTTCALEFMQGPMKEDPRYLPGWDSNWWATHHPLGLERLSHVTLAVSDIDKAKHIYVTALGGKLLWEGHSDIDQTASTFVLVGEDTVVELARSLEPESLIGRDIARNGDIMHATTWKVRDLDQAATYLKSKGVSEYARDDTTLVADPETTFGAVFKFTTADVRTGRPSASA